MKTVTSSLGYGGAFENYISAECARVLERGIASVSKNHEAAKIEGTHARTAKSKPDFSGHFMPAARGLSLTPGTHVVFEAKATDKASFPLSDLRAHQLEALQVADRSGAIAFLYVLRERDETKWIFPVWYVDEINMHRGSVPFDVEAFRKGPRELWPETIARLIDEGLWVF